MGYVVWDGAKGEPANKRRYWTRAKADRACQNLNNLEAAGNASRFYIKAL